MITLNKPTYPSKNVYMDQFLSVSPDFDLELKDIIDRCGSKQDFENKLKQRTKWICENKPICHTKSDWCEKMKYDPKKYLYSIKIKDRQNVRILFVFCGSTQTPILLCAFQEIAKGRRSDKIYAQYMNIAHQRVDILISNGFVKKEEIKCHS